MGNTCCCRADDKPDINVKVHDVICCDHIKCMSSCCIRAPKKHHHHKPTLSITELKLDSL